MLTTKPPYADMTHFQFMDALSRNSLTYRVIELVTAEIREPLVMFLSMLLQIDSSKRLKSGEEGADRFQELQLR